MLSADRKIWHISINPYNTEKKVGQWICMYPSLYHITGLHITSSYHWPTYYIIISLAYILHHHITGLHITSSYHWPTYYITTYNHRSSNCTSSNCTLKQHIFAVIPRIIQSFPFHFLFCGNQLIICIFTVVSRKFSNLLDQNSTNMSVENASNLLYT